GVAIIVAGAGLAANLAPAHARAGAGAGFDDAAHHLVHVAERAFFDDAAAMLGTPTPHGFIAAGATDARHAVRLDTIAVRRHRAIGADHFEQGHFLGAERKRMVVRQRRSHSQAACDIDHLIAAD